MLLAGGAFAILNIRASLIGDSRTSPRMVACKFPGEEKTALGGL